MKPGLIEILILAFVFVLVFGHRRLPELGRHLGRGMLEFKDGITGKGAREAAPVARDDTPLTP
jgi:Sec-independent protein secretion pathway components